MTEREKAQHSFEWGGESLPELRRPLGSGPEIGVETAARMIGTGRDNVIRLIEEGRISAYQLRQRGHYRINRDSVIAYLEEIRSVIS